MFECDIPSASAVYRNMYGGYSINAQVNQRGWYFLMWVIMLSVLAAHLLADIRRSPDFSPYVGITENLMSSNFSDLVPFETFSRGMLMISVRVFDDASKAVIFVHWINSLIFFGGFVLVTQLNKDNWQGALLAFATYGVLLCFVTLRATPAYLIAIYAVLNQRLKLSSCMILLILAACFHITALLVVPALLANYLSLRLSFKTHFKIYWCIYIIGIVSYVAIMLGLNFGAALGGFLGEYDDLVKFVTYAEEPQVASVAHRIYFLLMAILVAMFLWNKTEKIRKQKIFVCVSFAIVALSSISPVVAFRQSIYFTFPMLLIFPWGKWINSDVKAIVFWITFISLSLLNFISVFF